MNLYAHLRARAASGRLIRVGLIGAGRFGTMYLAQARAIPGVQVVGIADINRPRAEAALDRVGWPAEARSDDVAQALASGGTAVTTAAADLLEADLDIIVEATGNPLVGTKHALRALETGKHVAMVTVEADALVGPVLAERARQAGLVYSLVSGDQPALIWELVDWARANGFTVACAGKGAKYLPHYHQMNPDTVWEHWEFSEELTSSGQLNPHMHTSFRDGTKAAIEMAAVANAAGLVPGDEGLTFTPGNVEEIATVCRPAAVGGVLANRPTVEVMSSVTRDGEWIPFNTQEGVFVVVEATNDYVAECFGEYPWHPDPTGRYVALYRPYHYVGLELNTTIAHACLHGAATGTAVGFTADVVACAKQDLKAGDRLDGEGGYTVWGKLQPAQASVAARALPVALAHAVPLLRDVAQGQIVSYDDVDLASIDPVIVGLRRELEAMAAADGS
ncbi:MAG: NAD(P)H-dependent oxidoreductase [Propioniciclava sp.]